MEYKRLTTKKIDLEKLSEKAKSKISETYLDYAKMNNALYEWENNYESGKVVKLPCKVGDTVYWRIENISIIEFVVTLINISVGKKTHFTVWAKQKCGGVENDFSSDDLGEEWFITREEAEKRLKELQE